MIIVITHPLGFGEFCNKTALFYGTSAMIGVKWNGRSVTTWNELLKRTTHSKARRFLTERNFLSLFRNETSSKWVYELDESLKGKVTERDDIPWWRALLHSLVSRTSSPEPPLFSFVLCASYVLYFQFLYCLSTPKRMEWPRLAHLDQ